MYPFEVAWYKKQEMTVFYEGNPLLDRLAPFMQPQPKENKLMFLPGSRHQEIKTLMPIFVELIVKIKAAYPELMIGIARAESIPQEELLSYFPHEQICKNVFTIVEPQEKYPWLQQAFLAIAKPGTCTLELALLNTPSIIAYKVNPFTYWLARAVVCIDYMALPNLFLEKPVYKEFLQSDCNIESLYTEIENQYQDFLYHPTKYAKQLEELTHLKNHFLLIKYS
jgi:lipid-A-disaccharide synthase